MKKLALLFAVAGLLTTGTLTYAATETVEEAKAKAREEIRLYKADISKADSEISSRNGRIFAGDILIAANEVAIQEARKIENNDAAVIGLQIALQVLKSTRNDLVKERQDWERYRRECQASLAQWQAYLRKLGG